MHDIKKNYFSGGIIKSSGIGNNHRRRLALLKDITKLPFNYYAYYVNKSDIDFNMQKGLKYRKTFYKFFHKELYNNITANFKLNNIFIKADRIGGEDYIKSFKKYIHKNFHNNLFNQPLYENQICFDFYNDKDEVIIQLADFIAGTLGKIYDSKHNKNEFSDQFKKLIQKREFKIFTWKTF